MPNIKSAKKRVRKTKRQTVQNTVYKRGVKTKMKDHEKLDAKAQKKDVPLLQALIGKAVKRGVVHKNAAARYVRRIMKNVVK